MPATLPVTLRTRLGTSRTTEIDDHCATSVSWPVGGHPVDHDMNDESIDAAISLMGGDVRDPSVALNHRHRNAGRQFVVVPRLPRS